MFWRQNNDFLWIGEIGRKRSPYWSTEMQADDDDATGPNCTSSNKTEYDNNKQQKKEKQLKFNTTTFSQSWRTKN